MSAQIISAPIASADDFIVDAPSAVTNGGNTLDGDDNLTITSSGSISTVGADAVDATGYYNTISNFGAIGTTGNNANGIDVREYTTINNSGTISTTGNSSSGIEAEEHSTIINTGVINTTGNTGYGIFFDHYSTITNSGSITTSGNLAFGMYGEDNSTVTNTGSISTTGDNAYGIHTGYNNIITNTGSISTTGDDGYGIRSASNNTITNSGLIITTNEDAIGINAEDNNTINNTGTIKTTGEDAHGVSLSDTNTISNIGSITTSGLTAHGIDADDSNTLSNFGSITTTGNNAHGIKADDSNTIINSGLISATGTGADAILFDGANNALALNPGSVIIGPLNFVQATNTLSVGNGLSIANTFTGNAPASINSNGAPFAANGLQVAVVDPTNLAAQDELLGDLTGGIFSTVQNRLGSLRGGVSGVTSNPRPMSTGSMDGDAADRARQYWVQGFGAVRDQDGEGPVTDTDHQLAGFVSGLDAQYSAFTRAGFFLGGSWAGVNADFDSQKTQIDSFFGGVYVSTLKGRTVIDFAMTVGYSDYDRERSVANNQAATGIETARADYEGWFVSPELILTRPIWAGEQRFETSLTLRYSGLFLDGFTESGTAAPLTLESRDVHVLQARTQLTIPQERTLADGSSHRNAVYFGLEGRTQIGDQNVSGTLLTQNITFNPGGDEAVAGLFAGLELERTSASGMTFFANIEGQYESDGGRQASGKAGVRFRF